MLRSYYGRVSRPVPSGVRYSVVVGFHGGGEGARAACVRWRRVTAVWSFYFLAPCVPCLPCDAVSLENQLKSDA